MQLSYPTPCTTEREGDPTRRASGCDAGTLHSTLNPDHTPCTCTHTRIPDTAPYSRCTLNQASGCEAGMLFFTATETSDVVYQLRMSCELGDPTGSPQVCTRTSNPETSFCLESGNEWCSSFRSLLSNIEAVLSRVHQHA